MSGKLDMTASSQQLEDYMESTEDEFDQPFKLSNSKYGNLEKYKAAARERVDLHSPKAVSSIGMPTIKSDDTGHVPLEDTNPKSCMTKNKATIGSSTEEYTASRQAENEAFINANLNAVESLAPFRLKRVYGRQENVPSINLTGIYRNHIVYATSNVVIIYDYVDNAQHCLQGHRNTIKSLFIESKGRFLVSTDAGKRSLIIVWETMTGKPVKFLPEVHDDNGSIFACFTGVDYIFASVGAQETGSQTLCFWNFDSKDSSKTPILTGKFPKTLSSIRELAFLDSRPEFFAATGDRNVIFGTWIRDKKGDSLHLHKPRLRKSFIAKHKRFTSSLWMRKGEWLATATGAGYVCIWGPPIVLALEDPPDPNLNIREFQRSFKLCEDGITVFTLNKDYVVIGDEIGIVRFFDHEFKLLRWSRNFSLPPILSISFNLSERPPEFKKNLQENYSEKTIKRNNEKSSRVKDYTLGGKKFRQLSKTTLPKPPMPCPDFVVGVKGGNVYYYHFHEMQLDLLVSGTPGQFVTCDVCPGSNHIVFSTQKGEIQMYEFLTHKLIFNDKIFTGNHLITTMKFNPMGHFVAFGLSDGHVCFRRNYTWTTFITPLALTKDPVIRIVFTGDGLHLAYYDSSKTVVVAKYLPKAKGWMILGKSRAHKRDIADIQFFNDPDQGDRLFSLGLDRHLIEYDLERSSEDTGLFLVKVVNLEQTCRPTAMIFDGPQEFGRDCITFSNDINKMRIFSYKEEKVKMTCSGPVFGRETGIKRMIEFPILMSEDRLKKFVVYIVKNKLGLMDTPLDGNPHKYMAVFTHPKEILEVAVVAEKERIFTVGKEDDSAFVWAASPRAMEATVLMGGSGVAPFYQTLRRHWGGACQDIIKDLDMIFFFLNVKRINKQTEIYSMNRNIRISEIPAVCRACGFYPSEYEVSLMIEEVRRLKQANQHYTDDTSTEISFDEFIKLFVNHFYRVTDEDVEEAFRTLGFEENGEEAYVCRNDFITYLTTEGEAFSPHNFPIYFENMYGVQHPDEYGKVKCHTVQGNSESSSYVSYSSSSSSVSNKNVEEESSSVSSYSDEVDEEDEEGQHTVEDGNEEGRKNSDDQVQGEERKSKEEEFDGVEEREDQQLEKKSAMSKTQIVSRKSIKIDEESGRKSMMANDNDEFDFDNKRETFQEEDEELGEDDLTDIPERINVSYFLDVMLPAESQQTIRWKSKTERVKADEFQLEALAARKKEEKAFLNTLLRQIVDPTFPIPRKLLNSLLAEYYLEHGNFSVPSDLRYPGIGLPEDSWYKEDEMDGEFTPTASTSETRLSKSVSSPVSPEEGENADEEESTTQEELEGEGAVQSQLEIIGEGGTFTDEEFETANIDLPIEEIGEHSDTHETGAPILQSEIEYDETEEEMSENYGDDEDEGPYTPPFTMSEAPLTGTDPIMRDDLSEDGTEALTDLDNMYEEEDLDFVRSVNQSFRPKMDEDEEEEGEN